jgi:ribosome modulation factor
MPLLIVALLLSQNPFNTPYCKSFTEGWRAGYCQGKQACIAPPSPACPVMEAGANPQEQGWLDGWKKAKQAQKH